MPILSEGWFWTGLVIVSAWVLGSLLLGYILWPSAIWVYGKWNELKQRNEATDEHK